MKAIETIITATMLVDDERPPMDEAERLHTEQALTETVRTTLFAAFLQHEPRDSRATAQNVTATFSGHVLP